MAAFEVVVAQEGVEVALDFGGCDVPGLAACDAEAFIQQRAVHVLDEAVGARGGDFSGPVLDALHRQQQLERVRFGLAAELAAIVGEHGPYRDVEGFVERQDALVKRIGGGDGHLAGIDLGEGQGAEGIDDDLHIDLADTLERAPAKRVLAEQFAGRGGFDVLPRDDLAAGFFQQAHLRFGEHEGGVAGVDFQAQQAFVAGEQVVALPHAAHAGRAGFHALQP